MYYCCNYKNFKIIMCKKTKNVNPLKTMERKRLSFAADRDRCLNLTEVREVFFFFRLTFASILFY